MWFRTWLDARKTGRSCSPVRQASRSSPPCRLFVETFEDRCVPAATFSVGGATLVEGNAGTQNALVTVTVSKPHSNSITVNYRTADGTANAGSDYTAVFGKLTFAKGHTSKTILVPVRGDRVVESDECFSVRLSNPTKGALIANGTGFVTIRDDEPRISISDVYALERSAGTTAFTFTVRLSAAYDLPVSVSYATADGSAAAGSDYIAAAGSLTFTPGQPGQTSQTVTVLVKGDRLPEPDEAFVVNLSGASGYAGISKAVGMGTILDDEPRISISDAYNYGESSMTFTVSLSAAYDQDVTLSFATADGTALAGVDYVASSGPLVFKAGGPTTQTITVAVLDATSAPDKYFYVQLSGASTNAQLVSASAAGYWYYDYGYYDYGIDWGYYYEHGYYYGD